MKKFKKFVRFFYFLVQLFAHVLKLRLFKGHRLTLIMTHDREEHVM